jgi:hypothetical protein
VSEGMSEESDTPLYTLQLWPEQNSHRWSGMLHNSAFTELYRGSGGDAMVVMEMLCGVLERFLMQEKMK